MDARYRATVSAADVLPGSPPAERRMREMTLLNFAWFMQTLLERKDRMSMYSGLEVRVPFCDWRIAEYLYAVPWSFKDYRGHEKGLLRHAMRGLLPEEVLWRKKSPYPQTHHPDDLSAVSSLTLQYFRLSSARPWQPCRKTPPALPGTDSSWLFRRPSPISSRLTIGWSGIRFGWSNGRLTKWLRQLIIKYIPLLVSEECA